MTSHGRETFVTIINEHDDYVIKQPYKKVADTWLENQQFAARTIQSLEKIGNAAYKVPHVESIDAKNTRVIEERVYGTPLSAKVFHDLDSNTQKKLIDSLAQFYADIHSLDSDKINVTYTLHDHLYIVNLQRFINHTAKIYLPKSDIKFLAQACDFTRGVKYETRLVFSHNDLCHTNVWYDRENNRPVIIDFADAGCNAYLHADMLDPYLWEMGIVDELHTQYLTHCSPDNLPDNFINVKKWNKIRNLHHIQYILTHLDESAEILNLGTSRERTDYLLDKFRNSITKLRSQMANVQK